MKLIEFIVGRSDQSDPHLSYLPPTAPHCLPTLVHDLLLPEVPDDLGLGSRVPGPAGQRLLRAGVQRHRGLCVDQLQLGGRN